MPSIGDLFATLSIKDRNFSSTLGRAAGVAGRFGGRLGLVTGVVGGFGSKFASVAGLVAGGAATIAGGAALATAGLAALGIAGAAGLAVVTKRLGGLARASAGLPVIRGAFESLTSGIEGGSKRMLAALQDASAGMITNQELMRGFNEAAQLVSLNFAQRMPEAMQLLQKVSASTGQTMDHLIKSLTVGIGRLSTKWLDNLAITPDLSKAYETFAGSVGKSVEALTEAEKRTALTNQVLAKLRENTARLPDVTGTAQQAFARLRAGLENVRTEIGTRLLPGFREWSNAISNILPTVQRFGSMFADAFSGAMLGGLDAARSFVSGLASSFGGGLNEIAGSAHGWGANIVVSLAGGMASAVGAIVSVLNAIGNLIASFLAPGSPPKLLPKLPEWGTSAMNHFFQGMADADISVLSKLTGEVEQWIQDNMITAGQDAITKRIMETRNRLVRAFGGGDMAAAIRALPEPMRAYGRAAIAAAEATERAREAQERLNDITAEYERKLSPIESELDAIDKRRQELFRDQEKEKLESILSDDAASEQVKEMARLRQREIMLEEQKGAIEDERDTAVSAAEEKLKAAKEEEEQAKKSLDRQREIIDLQSRGVRLIGEHTKALESLAKAAGGGGGGGAADALDEMKEAIEGVGGAGANLQESLGSVGDRVRKQFEPLMSQMEELGNTWGRVIGASPNEGIRGTWNGFVSGISEDSQTVQDDLGRIGEAFREPRSEAFIMGYTVGRAFRRIRTGAENAITTLQEEWGAGGTWSGIAENAKMIAEAFGLDIDGVFGGVGSAVDGAIKTFTEAFGEGGTFATNVDLIKEKAPELGNAIGDAVVDAVLDVHKGTKQLEAAWGSGGTWDGIMDNAKTAAGLLRNKVKSSVTDIILFGLRGVARWGDEWGAGGTWDGIMTNAKTAVGLLGDKVGEAGGTIIEKGGEAIEAWKGEWGAGGTWDEIMENAKTAVGLLQEQIGEKIGSISETLNTFKTNILDKLATGFNTVKTTVNNLKTAIGNLKDAVLGFPLGPLRAMIEQSEPPLAAGIRQVNERMDIMAGRRLPALRREVRHTGRVLDMLPGADMAAGGRVAQLRQAERAPTGNTVTIRRVLDIRELHINDGSDMRGFERRVERATRRALEGRAL